MTKYRWEFFFAMVLISLSAIFYALHYWLFKDLHHIWLYLVGDIAFLFLDVLIVVMVLHRLLEHREKQSRMRKLYMVIGTFFIETGTELIRRFMRFEEQPEALSRGLQVTVQWSAKDFARARKEVEVFHFQTRRERGDLQAIGEYLQVKRPFLLSLLENPNLLEHEAFTDLLWSVFHLADELSHRVQLAQTPDADYQHLANDINRAYQHLVIQWLGYMEHLKKDYPYLFSLAVRTNPFDRQARPEVAA